jgi:hypothetical protein
MLTFRAKGGVASRSEMLVGAVKGFSGEAAGHERVRVVRAAHQRRIGQAALLGLVDCESAG